MTPADKRVLELLDQWLTSIELHLKYVELDGPSYQQVQPWPAHERPARWILELAQQKVLQLKSLCIAQIGRNDPAFAESLELMSFLANLAGAQHISRFIPLADPAKEQVPATGPVTDPAPLKSVSLTEDATRELPKLQAGSAPVLRDVERTREIPKLKMPVKRAVTAAPRNAAETKPRPASKAAASRNGGADTKGQDRAEELVIADAVRLLKWGKEWHELTELIARMAERPAPGEIRRILRSCKQQIESQLGR